MLFQAAMPCTMDCWMQHAGKTSAQAQDDVDAILADMDKPAPCAAEAADGVPVESLDTIEAVTAALAAPGVSKTRKQKLKRQLKKLEVRPRLQLLIVFLL
jgi:hypothetical protein